MWEMWGNMDKSHLTHSAKPTHLSHSTKLYMGCDVARFGKDFSVIAIIEDKTLIFLQRYKYKTGTNELMDTNDFADEILHEANSRQIPAGNIAVDGVGLGAGTIDALKKAGLKVYEIQSGSAEVYTKDTQEYRFFNFKSQMWWVLREAIRKGDLQIGLPIESDTAQKLLQDLTMPRYEIKCDKSIKVESKSDIKNRLGRSTDYGDALVYAFWVKYFYNSKPKSNYSYLYKSPQNLYDVFYG